jgi:hypothetical protein
MPHPFKELYKMNKLNIPGRFKVRDVSILYRMIAGFQGDVNRTHPASIEPVLLDVTYPPLAVGLGVIINAAGTAVRQVLASDTAITDIYGVLVRQFPSQPSTASNFGSTPLGGAQAPQSGSVADVLTLGYIMVPMSGATVAKKGTQAYIWIAATAGGHTQGAFEAAATSGSAILLPNTVFNGPADANGIVEIKRTV